MSVASQIAQIQTSSAELELHWYISSIVLPELPQLIETLAICSNLLIYNSPQPPDASQKTSRGPSVKLPLTLNKLDVLKGILVRDGAYITELLITLNQPNFNKVLHKLELVKPVHLEQISAARNALEAAIDNLTRFIEMTNSHTECDVDHSQLIELFNRLLSNISAAKQNLQIPMNPALVFPSNVMPSNFFRPELPENMAVDLYLNQAELCIDLKKLHIVKEMPWARFENGKLYVDTIRDEMKLPSVQSSVASSISTPTLKNEPLKLSELDSKLNDLTNKNFLNSMLTSLAIKPKMAPMDYITKCVTFNNMVVMVSTKIDVSLPDPVLTSVFTKLDSIEYVLGLFLSNLDSVKLS